MTKTKSINNSLLGNRKGAVRVGLILTAVLVLTFLISTAPLVLARDSWDGTPLGSVGSRWYPGRDGEMTPASRPGGKRWKTTRLDSAKAVR